ncbi:MAG: hypothetical protein R2715_16840 [Ilumatobacteraceae bacterium]
MPPRRPFTLGNRLVRRSAPADLGEHRCPLCGAYLDRFHEPTESSNIGEQQPEPTRFEDGGIGRLETLQDRDQ